VGQIKKYYFQWDSIKRFIKESENFYKNFAREIKGYLNKEMENDREKTG
jgi:hypothetical protein